MTAPKADSLDRLSRRLWISVSGEDWLELEVHAARGYLSVSGLVSLIAGRWAAEGRERERASRADVASLESFLRSEDAK